MAASATARVRVRGQAEINKTFSTLKAAQRWARRLEVELRDGRHFSDAAARRRTWPRLIHRYERDILALNPP